MKIYLLFLLTMSVITFVFYAADKIKAKRDAWRVPEKLLLSLGFFGGAAGGLIAMQAVRHKTRHYYFYAVNFLGLAWQIALGYCIYRGIISI